VVHFGAEKLNLLLRFFASTSHRLKVFEGEFLTSTFFISFTFCDILTPLFPEAIELTTTQDERIEMEHPSLLFFKPLYVVLAPPTILEVVVGFIL
jgi:hypothetical protein